MNLQIILEIFSRPQIHLSIFIDLESEWRGEMEIMTTIAGRKGERINWCGYVLIHSTHKHTYSILELFKWIFNLFQPLLLLLVNFIKMNIQARELIYHVSQHDVGSPDGGEQLLRFIVLECYTGAIWYIFHCTCLFVCAMRITIEHH